jgi:hypothetical protein
MHPHPAFREADLRERQREINDTLLFARFETADRPARRSFWEWIARRCPETEQPRVREAVS